MRLNMGLEKARAGAGGMSAFPGRHAALALLALLLLALMPHADDAAQFRNEAGQSFQSSFENNWQGIAIVAIAAGIFFNALVYMAGMALEAENLKRYARAEGLQITASALIIFFAVSLLYTLTNGAGQSLSALSFMGEVIGSGSVIHCNAEQVKADNYNYNIWKDYGFGRGPLAAFKCKVQEKITALDTAYSNLYNANMGPEKSLSICYMLFGAPVWCNSWDLSQHQKVEQNHLLTSKIVGLLMPLHAQYTLAEYLQQNMLAVFLPAGLVMRIFPFTRGLGGLFIAIAVGFFFVFPTFFVLTDSSFVKSDTQPVADTTAGMCFSGFKGAAVLQSIANSQAAATEGSLAAMNTTELLYQITIGAMFYPFVALVLTLIFVRALTPLLGGDLGELMKMVARLG